MKHKNSRTTDGGKGDAFRSDFRAYTESSFWANQHEWTSDDPEEEGVFQVKYYDIDNELVFDNVNIYITYDYNEMPSLSIDGDTLHEFRKDKAGLRWKFKSNI